MNRRELIRGGTAAIAGAMTLRAMGNATQPVMPESAPIRFRVHPIDVELAPRVVVPALGCNGSLTGPLIRVDPHDDSRINVVNDTNFGVGIKGAGIPHDLRIAGGARAIAEINPIESGFVCPQLSSQGTTSGSLSGIAGMFVRRESSQAVDQVHFLTIHHWLPSPAEGTGALLGTGVAYRYASLGDRLLPASEPIRVREGQRVHFHFVNASPTKCVTLSLPGHRFLVLALDGYAVGRPREVIHLAMGPGERIEALVHMTRPGRFVLGSIDRRDRDAGFGRVVEYAKAHGPAHHPAIESSVWNYSSFGSHDVATSRDVTVVPVTLRPANHGEEFHIDSHRLHLEAGRRYRLSIVNATGERTPVGLRDHHFELTSVAGHAMRGVVKDTIALPTFARTEMEFVAARPAVDLVHAANVKILGG